MTALTTLDAPTRPAHDANLRPVPWRRMAWVTWRQHRVALSGAAVFLGRSRCSWGSPAVTCITRTRPRLACNPQLGCLRDRDQQINTDLGFMNQSVGGYLLQVVPALIGAFVGAPVLARELETGTFRYAWTQGFEPWRWTLAKVAALAVVVIAVAGAMSVLFSWYYAPYFATANQARELSEASPFSPALFDLRGVAFVGWTLVAFAIGVLAGVVIRRVVAAMVATLAAYTGLAIVAGTLLRRHYLSPLLTSRADVPGTAWIYSQSWTKGGRRVLRMARRSRAAPPSVCSRCCRPPAQAHVRDAQPVSSCSRATRS